MISKNLLLLKIRKSWVDFDGSMDKFEGKGVSKLQEIV